GGSAPTPTSSPRRYAQCSPLRADSATTIEPRSAPPNTSITSRRNTHGGREELAGPVPTQCRLGGHSVWQCPGRSWLMSGDFAEVRYADADGVSIAYCIRGDGPIDLVRVR